LSQTNICSSSHNISITLELTEKDLCLNVMPLFHIHGLIGAIGSSLTAGAGVICTPGFDTEKFFEWTDIFKPTWYTAVPTMHQAILSRASDNQEIIDRHNMKFIRSCSASLPEQVMAELVEVFGIPVIESYGMTEASHQMTSNPLPPLIQKPGSVGIAAGPDVAIMDDGGNLLPAGEIGEVVIRGSNVTDGYEKNPKANENGFTNGWFRTGDQGRFDSDGYLFLTGRLKEIINRGGENIAPKEVDEILIQHPAIAQVVTFAVPHATLGEDVAAAVVLNENAEVNESEIRDFAATKLADFKVPSQVLVVDEIPKGPTGKLQRIGLADMLASMLQSDFVAPKNQDEKKVVDIWKDLLNVDQVGIHDNFFVIGGDSITASLMINKIENHFNTTISLDIFLRSPTVETIASFLKEKESSKFHTSILSGQIEGAKLIKDSFWGGIKNRLLQIIALYAPGFKTTRVWLHRLRGVSIGKNVSIGLGALIETAYPSLIYIGNNVSIGIRAIIIGHLRDLTAAQDRRRDEPTVRIEDNVYIGPGVIVLPNVTIGSGSVVSAGSVVSRSVPPQTLVQGNPAKPIARCCVSLGGGVSYQEFLRNLKPIKR
jgi:acetyltransferase-like isoleucine patch superfamily enzyme/acyl carrier protein